MLIWIIYFAGERYSEADLYGDTADNTAGESLYSVVSSATGLDSHGISTLSASLSETKSVEPVSPVSLISISAPTHTSVIPLPTKASFPSTEKMTLHAATINAKLSRSSPCLSLTINRMPRVTTIGSKPLTPMVSLLSNRKVDPKVAVVNKTPKIIKIGSRPIRPVIKYIGSPDFSPATTNSLIGPTASGPTQSSSVKQMTQTVVPLTTMDLPTQNGQPLNLPFHNRVTSSTCKVTDSLVNSQSVLVDSGAAEAAIDIVVTSDVNADVWMDFNDTIEAEETVSTHSCSIEVNADSLVEHVVSEDIPEVKTEVVVESEDGPVLPTLGYESLSGVGSFDTIQTNEHSTKMHGILLISYIIYY